MVDRLQINKGFQISLELIVDNTVGKIVKQDKKSEL